MAIALGVTLPVRLGANGYFETTANVVTQLKSNLRNLIMTKRGERFGNPSFGCDVEVNVFDPITDDTVANIRGSIESAVQTWMPFLTIQNVNVVKDEDNNTVSMTITFQFVIGTVITDSITVSM